jgi:hypothetical protein
MSPRVRFAVMAVPLLAMVGLFVVARSGAVEPEEKEKQKTEKEAPPQAIYHTDRDHLWNRVHAALLMRVGPDGKSYGEDRLEPLLWAESKNLLEGKTADRAVAVLEEFIKEKGETLIDDPLKRAVLQRDLWLVANWLALQHTEDQKRLEVPLAKVIRRLALTPEEIAKLPDTYAQAVASKKFADRFDPEKPEQPYLPPDLFKADGPWVCVGRKDAPTAFLHLDVHNADRPINPFTNSAFLVFLKLPGGRETALGFLKELAAFDKPLYLPNTEKEDKQSIYQIPNPALPQMPKGTEIALVRRALLIDSSRRIVVSPLVESIQFRALRVDTPKFTVETFKKLDQAIGQKNMDWQAFTEFQVRRIDLFAGKSGGLRDVSTERDFKTGFNAHAWDEFTGRATPEFLARPFPERSQPFKNNRESCIGCHQLPGVYSFNSFHTDFSFAPRRVLRDEPDGYVPKSYTLLAMPVHKVEEVAVKWKEDRPAWKSFRGLLPE